MPITLQNPYAKTPNTDYVWLRGNLHTHTTLSDGTRPPQTVIDLYAKLGHDFLAITDHDIFSDYSRLDPKGLILLPGNEVTAFGPHVLQIGAGKRIDPHEDRQHVINQINETKTGFAVLNHPNWEASWNHYPFELMQSLKGYIGIEIFNGVCLDLEGSHLGLDKWERLLSTGKIVWGFANDDSHRDNHEGRGWNVVMVPRNKVGIEGIHEAFRAGRFYGSTGVTIDAIETNGHELFIKAADAQYIEIHGEKGVRLAYGEGSEMRFDASKTNSFYIRAQLYGAGDKMAWTQPFLIKGGPADKRRAMEEKFGNADSPRPALKALRVEKINDLGTAGLETQWKNAPVSDLFYERRSGDAPEVKTELRALVSNTHLALKIDCEEPDMDKLRTRITEDGNGSLWTDESLEIFIDIEGKKQRYYQMMINTVGAFYAGYPIKLPEKLKYKTHAVRTPKGWSVEILLDLATLAPDIKVGPGTKFGFHMCRNRISAGKYYMWSWVGSSNHTPSRYGTLEM
jgi:hypothetical protein